MKVLLLIAVVRKKEYSTLSFECMVSSTVHVKLASISVLKCSSLASLTLPAPALLWDQLSIELLCWYSLSHMYHITLQCLQTFI